MVYGLQDVVLQRNIAQGGDADDDKQVGSRRTSTPARDVRDAPSVVASNCSLLRRGVRAVRQLRQLPQPPETWDAGREARMLIRCIYRCDQNFGSQHIFDVLRGRETDKVHRFNHWNLSTWGIGAEISEQQWRAVLRQLIAVGYVRVDPSTSACSASPATGASSSRAMSRCRLRVAAKKERASKKRAAAVAEGEDPLTPDDELLFEALRTWRKAEADERGVPAYVIFDNKTLRGIARTRPVHESTSWQTSRASARRNSKRTERPCCAAFHKLRSRTSPTG